MSVSIIVMIWSASASASALGQVLGVVVRSDQALLLAAEPREADLLARHEALPCDLLGDLELRRGARAVVI
jgi:hypothetical protein